MPGYFIFDIETIPDDKFWPPAPESDSDDKPAKKRAKGTDEEAPAKKEAFPPPPVHRPIVLAYVMFTGGAVSIGDLAYDEGVSPDAGERKLLEQWNGLMKIQVPVLVSFNGRGFDLPVLQARSLRHGVSQDWYHNRNYRYRYSEEHHVDLCDQLADYGATRPSKLDLYARLIGLPGKYGVDGSQVHAMWKDGKYEDIIKYCYTDVFQTAFVFLRWRLVKGKIDLPKYREIARSLYAAIEEDGRFAEFLGLINQPELFLDAQFYASGKEGA